jgi:hypothetical protein
MLDGVELYEKHYTLANKNMTKRAQEILSKTLFENQVLQGVKEEYI